MARQVAIGIQDFARLREENLFYVDKTALIREWWDRRDAVTLITRPRRFGKTLNMSMLDYYFSVKYAGRGDLFEGLTIWEEERFRQLQGMWPVILLSFAGVKHTDFGNARATINALIAEVFRQYRWMLEDERFTDEDRFFFRETQGNMSDSTAALSLKRLCEWLYRFYGKRCILLLDEYDTPIQEAWLNGYWEEMTAYIRALFNNTFKTNPFLERGLMTGITRVSHESIFSDLNNLRVVTMTSGEYATAFGFTEEEVFSAMTEQGIPETEQEKVKLWYDGFTIGGVPDLYNPWSVILYLDRRKFGTYWANTSGNDLVNKLIREGDSRCKMDMEILLNGGCIEATIDEQVPFHQLPQDRNAVWSLLLATGYLKAEEVRWEQVNGAPVYRMSLTNHEVSLMFTGMIRDWFGKDNSFNDFVVSMLRGDVRGMNHYMNRVALQTFSYFDAGNGPSAHSEPERFYHGFVLGLLVDRAVDYLVKSNRESGYGRYDVVMEPKNTADVAVTIEFKVMDSDDNEAELADTAENALRQIEEKQYAADLLARGIPEERILKYGFAFAGERCWILKG